MKTKVWAHRGASAYAPENTLEAFRLAAEQKARTVYDNLLRMIPDPEVREPLKFLRAREIVHFQRFGEAMEKVKEKLDGKNFYYYNPEFDKGWMKEETTV